MKLIDTHCHLSFDYKDRSVADLIGDAKTKNVNEFIAIATQPDDFESVRKISHQFSEVFHTVGVHPHEVTKFEANTLADIRLRAEDAKCVAIGEIGLDYFYEFAPKGVQVERLEEQLGLAADLGLPVVIHSRDAETELLPLLRQYAESSPLDHPGVIHCFTGTKEFGQECLDLGFFISCSGIITFKTADALRAAIATYPLDRLLVETDSPFLAPVPHRGKQCEPSMVGHTAEKLAEIKGIGLDEVAAVTTANARILFSKMNI